MLEGTTITDAQIEQEVSRYDMAVVLAHCAELLGVPEADADTSKITDYAQIPDAYAGAVALALGIGIQNFPEGRPSPCPCGGRACPPGRAFCTAASPALWSPSSGCWRCWWRGASSP